MSNFTVNDNVRVVRVSALKIACLVFLVLLVAATTLLSAAFFQLRERRSVSPLLFVAPTGAALLAAAAATAAVFVSVPNASTAAAVLAGALPNEPFRFRAYALTRALIDSAAAGGDSGLCIGAVCAAGMPRFFVAEPPDGGDSNLINYLDLKEAHVRSAFTAILASSPCSRALASGKKTVWCGAKTASQPEKKPVVLDVGSNSGFYTMLAASLGAHVTAIDPQPQCSQFVRSAAFLSGFGDQVRVINAFAAGNASDTFANVPIRTGCWGTYPRIGDAEAKTTRAAFANIPRRDELVAVPGIDLPALVRELAAGAGVGGGKESAGVLLMKMDSEGAEGDLMAALDATGVLREHLVKNFVIELNKIAAERKSTDHGCGKNVGECYYLILKCLVQAGYSVIVHNDHDPNYTFWSPQEVLLEKHLETFAHGPWSYVDIWAFIDGGAEEAVLVEGDGGGSGIGSGSGSGSGSGGGDGGWRRRR